MPNRIIVGTSNLNMPLRDLLGSRRRYDAFREQGGYDGFQLMPVRGKAGLYDQLVQESWVLSIQESWVLAGSVLPALRQKNGLQRAAESLAVTMVFPGMAASHDYLRRMRAVARAAGMRDLPVVVHPGGQELGHPRPAKRTLPKGILKPSWRLTSELLDGWDIDSDSQPFDASDMARRINHARKAHKLGTIVLDTNHATTRQAGEARRRPIPHIVELAGALVAKGLIEQVEISLRPDFGGGKGDISMVRDGHLARTIHGQLLEAVAANMPVSQDLRVITEVRAGAAGVPLRPFHALLTDQIRGIVQPYLPHSL